MKDSNQKFSLKGLLILLIFAAANISLMAQKKSQIGIDFKPGINYVTHLYTLGDIGYNDTEYHEKYGHSVSAEDKELLRKHSGLLAFGQGKVGTLTSYFFFIPAYADLKSRTEYETYFNTILKVMKQKSVKPIKPFIPKKYLSYLDEKTIEALIAEKKSFEIISTIYLSNITHYMNEVYPEVSIELSKQKNHLNQLLASNNIMEGWQKVTNYNWTKGDYTYLLFRGGNNGPSFNNLTDNINTCYYKIDEKYLVDMFSHEFGIFLMYDSIAPLLDKYKTQYPDYESKYTVGRPYWMAFEMLAIFFNTKVNNRKTYDYYSFKEADPIAFMEIYEDLYEKGVRNPRDLYRKGIEIYMQPGGYWENGVKERYESM